MRGRYLPDWKFNKRELAKGIKVEYEHTKRRSEAKKIAKDHLAESKCYYKYLARMEKRMKRRCRR